MIELIKANTKFFFITWGIVLLVNQIFIFGGCFASYCIVAALPHTGVISAVIVYLNFQEEKEKTRQEQERSLESQYIRNDKETDPLKEIGDAYEKEIGKEFESKGDFVIYNGLISGVADGGVDLIVISPDSQSINLVQCKNWHKMKMEHHHISSVYDKLTNYASNINYSIGYIVVKYSYVALQKHLHYKKECDEIANILKATKNYTNIRKTLYISTDKVLDPDINQYIKMIKPNIFRYKDMKIVISKI